MATNNTIPASAIPPFNQTYVQPGKSNSLGIIILTLLLFITVLSFGGYVYYKELYLRKNTDSAANISPRPTQHTTEANEPNPQPTSALSSKEKTVVLTYIYEGPSTEDPIQLRVPEGTTLEEVVIDNLNTQIIKFPDGDLLKISLSHGGGVPETFDLTSATTIKTENYGEIFRIDNRGQIMYAQIQTQGTCVETLDGPVLAPCGYPTLYAVNIVCESPSMSYKQCDQAVQTIANIEVF